MSMCMSEQMTMKDIFSKNVANHFQLCKTHGRSDSILFDIWLKI